MFVVVHYLVYLRVWATENRSAAAESRSLQRNGYSEQISAGEGLEGDIPMQNIQTKRAF